MAQGDRVFWVVEGVEGGGVEGIQVHQGRAAELVMPGLIKPEYIDNLIAHMFGVPLEDAATSAEDREWWQQTRQDVRALLSGLPPSI